MSDNVMRWSKEVSLVVSKYLNQMPDGKEDLTQECYVALLKAGDKVDSSEYAYTVCFNHLFNYIRDNAEDGDILDENIEATEPRNENDVICDQLLRKLPPSEEFVIRHLYGINVPLVSAKTLARNLNMTESSLTREKQRILKKLKGIYASKNRKNRKANH